LDLTSIKLLKSIEKVLILDSLDEFRTNHENVNLPNYMNMNQRIVNIENWLINNNWKLARRKIVRNVHFVGKIKERVIRKETVKLKSHVVTLSSNEKFEKLNNPCLNKIDKAINYLK
jgi:hypothetical protein